MRINLVKALSDTIRNTKLTPSIDITIHTRTTIGTIDIDFFWHQPSLNLTWYPICQIDLDGKTIFHREGSENRDYYHLLANEAADKIESLERN